MNWLLFHIAGGGAFAIGLGLLFVAMFPHAAWLRNPARVSVRAIVGPAMPDE